MPLSGPGLGPLIIHRDDSDTVYVTAWASIGSVTTADAVAGAGVEHVLDDVLLPFYTALLQVGDGGREVD